MVLLGLGCAGARDDAPPPPPPPSPDRVARLDELSALWSFYQFRYVEDGRVVSLDEDRITTSEGQGYGMLRAVWSDDRETFDRVWDWTKRNLQVRDDRLFAWKWKGRVLDVHSATDADSDIALALLLAARLFEEPAYETEALEVIRDIWRLEILDAGGRYFPVAGDWALREKMPTLHVAYLAPYAYAEFAKVDDGHPWARVIETSYDVLRWLFVDRELLFPPEIVYVARESGELHLESPRDRRIAEFGYDAFPIYWRVAADERWHGRWQGELRAKMLAPLRAAYDESGSLYDRYTLRGQARSKLEALPLYATAHSLAAIEDRDFARRLREEKLDPLWEKALAGRDTPYYLHNWLWFDAALDVGVARRFDEFLSFLHPFDTQTFVETFPWAPFVACLLVFPVARAARGPRLRPIAVGLFLVPAFAICLHYLVWRGVHSLNFVEPLGPVISLALWGAELYCFVSVVFLVVQVGTRAPRPRQRPAVDGFAPSVDVMIPIFREPLDILERTLLAARSMDYPDFEVHVLDDGHREEVRALAERLGARYIEGPKRHAKAGNLNHALSRTTGDLVVVFDTDHVPVRTFLAETVPFFSEEAVGFVQTPHHFGNADIFQHGFRVSGRIPNEQDMFNHGIQSRRDGWGGSFFVGSGAVFRRKAIEGVGGFKLLSITEDIHTSQHLHAAGWTSVFVDRDLAVGLSAENLASYLVQRRRWMLGCLQIFFRDNPLFCRGLSLRHRVGYLASLYYFFFPLARVVFWSAPLAYLLFHLHPIFSDVAVLTALLIPYLVVLPMIPAVLIPDWPRPFWGSFYENAVSAPLARSMVDLLLPRSLGFAVTPKGLVTETSRFDWSSSRWTLLVAGITVFAIAKGLWEFWIFGIEKDAYFFNLAWAGYNLVFLAGAAMIAWERPQRRGENRVVCDLPARLEVADEERAIAGRVVDLSLSGCSVELDGARVLPRDLRVGIGSSGHAFEVAGRVVYQERMWGRVRVGVAFEGASEEVRRTILLGVMADPATWSDVHARDPQSCRVGDRLRAGRTALPVARACAS
ncbi:MAG: glycosyl hydrolase family 8 [Myxococcota bacterium]